MVLRCSVLLGLVLTAGLASDAVAADIGIRASALGLLQEVDVQGFSPNVEIGAVTEVFGFGGTFELELPILGLRIGGTAARHLNEAEFETAPGTVVAPGSILDVDATFALDATEFGGFLETQYAFMPWTIQEPFLGVGAAYTYVEIDGELVTSNAVATRSDLRGTTNVARVYGIGGFQLVDGLELVARGGYAFHDGVTMAAENLRATGVPAGATFRYEGLFATLGLAMRIR